MGKTQKSTWVFRKFLAISLAVCLCAGPATAAAAAPPATAQPQQASAQADAYKSAGLGFLNAFVADEAIDVQVEPYARDARLFAEDEDTVPDDWTIAVYMCGTDLESGGGAATLDLHEMLLADIPEDVNLLVMTGGTKTWDPNNYAQIYIDEELVAEGAYTSPSALKTQIWRVTDDAMELDMNYNTEGENFNMGDPETITGFLQYAIEKYPAEHLMSIVWDHGGGPVSGAAFDEYTGDSLSLLEMDAAFAAITEYYTEKYGGEFKFDLIGFDACLMSNMEVANIFAPYADYFIASLEVEPGSGWYYTGWLDKSVIGTDEDDAVSPDYLGQTIIDSYAISMRTNDWTQVVEETLALTDLSKIDGLTEAFDAMAAELYAKITDPESDYVEIARAAERTQFSTYRELIDLYDFCVNASPWLESAQGVINALGTPPEGPGAGAVTGNGAVVYRGTGQTHDRSLGLSFFFPVLKADLPSDAASIKTLTDTYAKWGVSENYPDFLFHAIAKRDELKTFTGEMTIDADEDATNYVLHLSDASAVKDVNFFITQTIFYDDDDSMTYYLGQTSAVDADWEHAAFTDRFDGKWFEIGGESFSVDGRLDFDDLIVLLIPCYVNEEETLSQMIVSYTEADDGTGTYEISNIITVENTGAVASRDPKEGMTIQTVLYEFDMDLQALTGNLVKNNAVAVEKFEGTAKDEDGGKRAVEKFKLPITVGDLSSGQDVEYAGYFSVTDLTDTTHLSEPVYYIVINDVNETEIADIPNQTYTGRPITPKVRLLFLGKEYLTEGIHYKVQYENNVNVGTATVMITGLGDVQGSVETTFRIVAPVSGGSGGSGGTTPTPAAAVDTDSAKPSDPAGSADSAGSTLANMFNDVRESDWFYSDVEYVIANGLFNGVSATDFAPNVPMSRAMLAMVLYRMAGNPTVPGTGDPFSDVTGGEWYSGAVAWAKETGLVSGYENGAFRPGENITREQMATILYRYEQFAGKAPSDIAADSEFSDRSAISDYAKDAVNALSAQGVINGKPDNLFDPQGMATRAEAAAMLHRFAELDG
jgi:hypothetical protein